ncbi:aminotransferase [Nonomuraea sp. NPDC050643]|uniref:aminotransferase n=1 Tax=Nonomuraea sp. NPDC050643 TaxID=3155660 RepID=UPI0033C171BD
MSGSVWHPMSGYDPQDRRTVMVSGDGVWVTDDAGRRYLDAKSGLWCVNAGYGRDELAEVAREQLRTLPYYPLTDAHLPALRLGEKLGEWLGGGYVFFFSNSGSEANEVAFKIARQYHQQAGEPYRWKIISRYRAYHGQTPGALAATGQNERRYGYEPLPGGFVHVAPPDPYRCHLCEGACSLRCAAEVERVIGWELPETVAAVIAEPVISGGGVIVPPDGYLAAVAGSCARSGALLIVDEAICGFGRTGRRFGYEHSGITPDIVTMAKAVANGYFPLAVTAVRREIHERFAATGYGRLRHINTFGGHPAGCAVALRTMEIMDREELPRRAAESGAALAGRLKALSALPHVGDVRGLGLLAGIELVADRASRRPVGADVTRRVVAACRDRGVIVGMNAGTAAGLANVIMIGPPLIAREDELDLIATTLEEALQAVPPPG